MQDPSIPFVKDIVLVGGGHAHALVLRMWAMDPLPGARMTLIDPGPVVPYTGMLPGLIAGHYQREEIMIDLIRLARFANARVILDRATGIDRDAATIHLAGRPPLPYDIASLDIGITSDLPDLPGFAEHTVSAKPLGPYAALWDQFLTHAPAQPRLVIIGGGVGGVELALASAHRLRGTGRQPQITLLQSGPQALPGVSARGRRVLLAALQAAGVTVALNTHAQSAGPGFVMLADGTSLPSDFTLTVAGARPQPWLADTGLTLSGGFVSVGESLQSSDPAIFAVGDCADLTHAPRPKAGVFAVRAAPVLLHNLRAALTETPLRAFHPQADYLKLVSLGGKRALADKWGMQGGGAWLWRLKDRIDRRFMDRFGDYPAMGQPALPKPAIPALSEAMGDGPLCGGCGAKVGPSRLAGALAALPLPMRADVISGAGDDAAQLRHGAEVQVITTDHLRAFTCDPRLMAQVTAVHALGDVWAMGAKPQVALCQITLPRLSPDLQSRMIAEVMQAATPVFAAAGADIVGGHTTVGSELTIGFTVTGLARRPLTKAGARPGDAILLTKALGSGTIMAAEMAMARLDGPLLLGEAVAAAFAAMTRPQGEASATLSPHARAMTDISGFGLLGHLMEVLEASGCAATLLASRIPLLPGAAKLAAAGHASTIAPANRAALLGQVTGAASPLMYDPQTGCGLLAVVPADLAQFLLTRLRPSDPESALIGHITEGPPRITIQP